MLIKCGCIYDVIDSSREGLSLKACNLNGVRDPVSFPYLYPIDDILNHPPWVCLQIHNNTFKSGGPQEGMEYSGRKSTMEAYTFRKLTTIVRNC